MNWLAFLNKYKLHGILCDDMGLGKTLQSICILAGDHFLRYTQVFFIQVFCSINIKLKYKTFFDLLNNVAAFVQGSGVRQDKGS